MIPVSGLSAAAGNPPRIIHMFKTLTITVCFPDVIQTVLIQRIAGKK